jgi:type IV pilus assembly protein PilA
MNYSENTMMVFESSNKNLLSKNSNGFTIVELLIVVVVIAILSAITIVSYNGIQKRAQTVSYATAANQTYSQLQIFKTTAEQPGLYAGIGAVGQPGELPTSICVGQPEDFPATTELAAGECRRTTLLETGEVTSIRIDETFSQRIRTAKLQAPKNLPTIKLTSNGQSIISRGVVLIGIVGSPAYLSWIAPDMSSCGRGMGVNQSLINQVKSDPALLAQFISAYGENWASIAFGNIESCLITLGDLQ